MVTSASISAEVSACWCFSASTSACSASSSAAIRRCSEGLGKGIWKVRILFIPRSGTPTLRVASAACETIESLRRYHSRKRDSTLILGLTTTEHVRRISEPNFGTSGETLASPIVPMRRIKNVSRLRNYIASIVLHKFPG